MQITKRDLAIILVMAVATAIVAYFAAGRSVPAAVIGLFVGAMGWVIPAILLQIVRKKS